MLEHLAQNWNVRKPVARRKKLVKDASIRFE